MESWYLDFEFSSNLTLLPTAFSFSLAQTPKKKKGKNNLFRYRVLWKYFSTRPSRQLLLVSASHRNNLFRRDICTLKYLSTQSLCHLLLLSASLETPKQRQTLGIVILGLWIIFQLSPPVNFFKFQPPTNPEKARECTWKQICKVFFFLSAGHRAAAQPRQPRHVWYWGASSYLEVSLLGLCFALNCRRSASPWRQTPRASAESQQIAVWWLLYCVRHRVRKLSRLQMIWHLHVAWGEERLGPRPRWPEER